ncbi:MAG TPA: SUMF1/EgtB/PvdO family nonheme iron enzyme [Prolixibacteraceae bacterium]|nr:SUMF1/EgtB/PvdO family nonheme iron enzyme [Prolixibacteraceae bacterium]
MKKYKLIISLLIIVMIASCTQSGESGELYGTGKRGSWFEPVPFGMTFVKRGSIRVGPSDEDPTRTIDPTKTISIDAFWMDDTEITNNEYRVFVNWVKDSMALDLLNRADGTAQSPYAIYDANGNFVSLDYKAKIDWADTTVLGELFLPAEERFFGKREIDSRKLFFEYQWIDYQKAAQRANSFNYKTGKYDGGIKDRSDFIVREREHIYPDTLCWIRDFTYSYNEPWTSMYFWHPGFDYYPVVGVNWKQANAFCQWRSKMQDMVYGANGQATVMAYRLPTEYEWEYAARGGLQNSMYPWGGYYSRNQMGAFMANYKPMRGNYILDGGLATMKVASYPPNDFGLYDMAGNVAEWTITAWDVLSTTMVSQINPNFQYRAEDSDPPAMKRKVIRGGSWKDVGYFIQTSSRTYEYQDSATSFIGFRCVRSSFGNEF